jgi:hypothetical protein
MSSIVLHVQNPGLPGTATFGPEIAGIRIFVGLTEQRPKAGRQLTKGLRSEPRPRMAEIGDTHI